MENPASTSNEKQDNDKQKEEIPFWVLGRQGINLIINNENTKAEELFLKYPNNLVMFAGYTFTIFMDALMSFEEEKLNHAIATLKEVERRCTAQTGWLKSWSSKVFGNGTSNSENQEAESYADQLETQIILADSQVCIAILTFLQQDLTGYFKGGWVLRKAWKVYQRTYKEILQLYRDRIGELHLPDPAPTPISPHDVEDESTNDKANDFVWNIPNNPSNGSANKIDKNTIIRLMGAISFGYGLFQLGVSLLPPNLARIVTLLGFAANRQNGISCLMYARVGEDMRAPLASLALLWYHTIVRPFYAIDGTNVQAGVNSSWSILRESEQEFPNSALFLFFRGRASRLQSDIPQAVKSFNQSIEYSKQREIKLLSLHEVGWCYLISLNYTEAMQAFVYLKCQSRWSKAFYAYLSAICTGSAQDFCHFDLFDDLHKCIASSPGGQLDEFLNRRKACCPPNAEVAKTINTIFWKLLVFEMLYLWNCLASCNLEGINQILNDCANLESPLDEPRKGLALLILGNVHIIQNQQPQAIISFRQCLEVRRNETTNAQDAHISAYAQFELGNLLIQSEETKAEGKLLLQQISRYSKYDFEGRLVVRVHNTLKNL